MSTGMSDMKEINEAVAVLESLDQGILFFCIVTLSILHLMRCQFECNDNY